MGQLLGNRVKSAAWPIFFLLVSCLGFIPSEALGKSYTYSDIHPAGWIDSRVMRVNGRGEAVGSGTTDAGERGFLWSAGRITVLLPPGADSARAAWINDRGEIAGTWVKDGVSRAFLLRDGIYLDPTPGWAYSEATYVGEDGAVGGTGEFGAFVSRGGALEILPGFSVVVAGNSSQQFIGIREGTACLYLPRQGYLPLTPPGTAYAAPHEINENGRVAVTSVEDGVVKGFVYSAPFFVVMTPPGWTTSRATSINNFEIVGGYGDSPEGRRSFLRRGGDYEILSFPGWIATEVVSVNDSGEVAGSGTTASGEIHAFVASPAAVPAVEASDTGGSGGCVMAPRRAGGGPDGRGPADPILLGLPLLLLLFRRNGTLRVRRTRDGDFAIHRGTAGRTGGYSPRILTRTRFLLRPSNSP